MQGESVILLTQETQGGLSLVRSAIGLEGQVIVIKPKTVSSTSRLMQ